MLWSRNIPQAPTTCSLALKRGHEHSRFQSHVLRTKQNKTKQLEDNNDNAEFCGRKKKNICNWVKGKNR